MGVILRKVLDTREEVELLESVDADDERRSRGAGVGARLRIESLRLRELEGCACALVSGWKRVEVSKWTGILMFVCGVVVVVVRKVVVGRRGNAGVCRKCAVECESVERLVDQLSVESLQRRKLKIESWKERGGGRLNGMVVEGMMRKSGVEGERITRSYNSSVVFGCLAMALHGLAPMPTRPSRPSRSLQLAREASQPRRQSHAMPIF